jgi:methenyltetrahydromethanopterin cyclohydrolase
MGNSMASGLFIGLTEDELLLIKSKAVTLITEGKTLMSYSDSGSSASKSFAMPPKEMLAEAMFALSQLDPSTYGSRKSVVNTNWNNSII